VEAGRVVRHRGADRALPEEPGIAADAVREPHMPTSRTVRDITPRRILMLTVLAAALGAGTIHIAAQTKTAGPPPETLGVSGLERPVDVLRDRWGINHIYAQSEHDLFFAQGYNAAKDRLFQFEIWRRQATGTVAEILGKKELKRDIGTRLHMFRGDLKTE